MLGIHPLFALLWALTLPVLVLSVTPAPGDLSVRARNLPGQSDEDTYLAIRRRLAAVANQGTFLANTSASLEYSWEDANLYSLGDVIHIRCTKCYFKAAASVHATIADQNFNVSQAVDSLEAQVSREITNLTTTALDAAVDFVGDWIKNVLKGKTDVDSFSFDNYTIDTDFDIDMPPVTECHLKFSLDNLELYLQLGVLIQGSSTYIIPIFQSQSELGFSIGDELEMGAFITADLIISAQSDLDIESGFHIKFEDGIVFDIALFAKNLSSIAVNGGTFEFLPVIIDGDATLHAVLRVGIHAGFQLSSPEVPLTLPDGFPDLSAGAGVEVGVLAHVAEFLTNVSGAGVDGNQKNNHGCLLAVRQEYTLGLGVAAGATLHLGDNTWRPQLAQTTPIFYTTLTPVCATSGNPQIPAPTDVPLRARQGMETTTTTTKVKYTAIECEQTGAINCPMSLQRTVVERATTTLSAIISSGQNVDWDSVLSATVPAGVSAKAVEFGSAVQRFGSSSGVPTSWVPPSETGGGSGGFDDVGNEIDDAVNTVDGLSTKNKIIIGASVGGGVALLIGIGIGVWCSRRKRQSAAPAGPHTSG
ncbi:hypothetical protein V8F20_010210 [Naviculisporaceae sp. PSN 640]